MRMTALPALIGAALLTLHAPAAALPSAAHERAEAFATCAGRYSAMAAHARARQDGSAAGHSRMQETFGLLLDATLPHAAGLPPKQEKRWAASGWRDIAFALAAAGRSEQGARDRLDRHLDRCAALIL